MVIHKKIDIDLAPAQRENFHAPILDFIYMGARHWLGSHPVLMNIVLSVPSAISAFLATCIAWAIFPIRTPGRLAIGFAAAVIGASGAAGLPTTSTTQSEMIASMMLLGAIWIIVETIEKETLSTRPLLTSGVLVGVAIGLKLTNLPYAVAAGAAFALTSASPPLRRARYIAIFGVGIVMGALVTAGPWWVYLTLKFGNPLFPYYNNIFKSPYYDIVTLTDERFKPHGLLQWLFYPFYWGFGWRHPSAEAMMRDPRFAIALVSLSVITVHATLARAFPSWPVWKAYAAPSRRMAVLLVFFAFSYIFWESMFSIFRYIAPIEQIVGIVIVSPFLQVQNRRAALRASTMAIAVVALLCFRMTIYPDWGRVPIRGEAMRVVPPTLEPNSMVVMLNAAPLSFIATYYPDTVRFVGANNSLVSPGQKNLFATQVEATIRDFQGPLWGLEGMDPGVYPTALDDSEFTLHYYGLKRQDCVPVETNVKIVPPRMCRLERSWPSTPRQ